MYLRGQGGVKYLGFIKVYDAFLYTPKASDTANILAPEISKCLKLDYDVSLTPENFIEGANTVLARQHTKTTLRQIESEMAAMHKAYKPVKEGDNYLLCYDGERGVTTLLLNQVELVSVQSPEFGNIYLGIWLGPKDTIDDDLRDDLLLKN